MEISIVFFHRKLCSGNFFQTALMIGKRMLSVWKTNSKLHISSDHSTDNYLFYLQEFSDKESSKYF